MSCLASAVICLWARAAALASRLRAFKRAKSAPERIWIDAGSSFGEELVASWRRARMTSSASGDGIIVSRARGSPERNRPDRVAEWVPPALDRDRLLSNALLYPPNDDSASFSRTTMSLHRHSDSGTIPSMTSVQHELRYNTVIVGKRFTPPSKARPLLTSFPLVFGASGDLAKKKVGTIGN
jgi:hypothetical protein